MAIVVRRCLLLDQPLVSPRQRTRAAPGQPSHDLINQNRFFRHMLIIKEARDRRWPPLPPPPLPRVTGHLSIADSGHSGQRVTASYRHGVIPSRRHTVDHAHRQKGAISSLTTYLPWLSPTDTASSLTGLAYLLIRPSSQKKSADKYIRNN